MSAVAQRPTDQRSLRANDARLTCIKCAGPMAPGAVHQCPVIGGHRFDCVFTGYACTMCGQGVIDGRDMELFERVALAKVVSGQPLEEMTHIELPQPRTLVVEESFDITGGGVAVVFRGSLEGLPLGIGILTLVVRSDGTSTSATAFVEMILRHLPESAERAALLLKGLLNKEEVPPGSTVKLFLV